jgi:hypothetical protein
MREIENGKLKIEKGARSRFFNFQFSIFNFQPPQEAANA